MADDDLVFRGTCRVFELKTCNDDGVLGKQFIDPCSCYSYYQCSNYKMIQQTCAGGTAWDFETKGCKHFQDVIFNQNCSANNVWTRCNVTEPRMDELKYLCTNETTPVPTTSTTQPTTRSDELTSDKINPGVIIGSIIGGAIIAVIVLVVAFCLYRRKKRNSINKKRSGTIAHNPEYFEGGQPDDPYAVINDDHVIQNIRNTAMNDPTYNGTVGGSTMSRFTNAGFDSNGEDAVYDNSGAPIVGPGYTSTIRRSTREYETAHTSRENLQSGEPGSNMNDNVESGRKGGNSLDLNGNRNKSSVNNGQESEMTSPDMASGSQYTEGHTNENSPDYFILEQTDDHL